MRNSAANWILVAMLTITCMTNYTLWLPMVRCVFDGQSYQWSTSLVLSQVGGRGTADDFWVLVLMTGFVLTMLYLGSRGAKGLFSVMFFGWFGAHFFASLMYAIHNGSDWRFRGDTMGIDVPLNIVMPSLYVVIFLLAGLWLWLSRGDDEALVSAWSRWNIGFLTVAAAAVPLQFVLLSSGEPHGLTDQIGVLLTVAQWILLCMAVTFPNELFKRRVAAAY